jgi:hypothetical protein
MASMSELLWAFLVALPTATSQDDQTARRQKPIPQPIDWPQYLAMPRGDNMDLPQYSLHLVESLIEPPDPRIKQSRRA